MSDEAYKPTHYLLFGILYKEQMGPYSKWFEKYVRTQKKAKARDTWGCLHEYYITLAGQEPLIPLMA